MAFLAGLFLGVILGFLVGVRSMGDAIKKELKNKKNF